MARHPVTCTRCGYTTVPVSGFCPRCLEPLPLGRRIAVLPLLAAGVLAVVVLGSAFAATLRLAEPGRVAVQAERNPASAPSPTASQQPTAVSPASTETGTPRAPSSVAPSSQSPSSSGSPQPSGQAPSATALTPAGGVAAPSPSSAPASPAALLPSTATEAEFDRVVEADLVAALPLRSIVRDLSGSHGTSRRRGNGHGLSDGSSSSRSCSKRFASAVDALLR